MGEAQLAHQALHRATPRSPLAEHHAGCHEQQEAHVGRKAHGVVVGVHEGALDLGPGGLVEGLGDVDLDSDAAPLGVHGRQPPPSGPLRGRVLVGVESVDV
eukprot:148580-Lingulodinium_polyedra.AAC.1